MLSVVSMLAFPSDIPCFGTFSSTVHLVDLLAFQFKDCFLINSLKAYFSLS